MSPETVTTPPSIPPPPSDFRTAAIKNHWNDPPKKIFTRSTESSSDNLNVQEILAILANKLELCKSTFESGPQKRVYDDTSRRIDGLMSDLKAKKLSDEVIQSLDDLTKALEGQEYAKAMQVQTQLMTTQYDAHGNWILGLKRLIDLTEKAAKA